MTWSQRRKISYVVGLLTVLSVIAGFAIRQATQTAPTCFDNKQNQKEFGVDCGGPCAKYCVNELSDPKIRWKKVFEIRPGIYHAVAYIEHTYPTAAAQHVGYTFKMYDENNTLIAERSGTTFLGTMGRTAIVETLIKTGKAKPSLVRFTFNQPISWEKVSPLFSQAVFGVERTSLESFTGGTRLTAIVKNSNRIEFYGVPIVALLYDAQDNVITASQSIIPHLPAEESTTVSFTWPFALSSDVAHIEIIPRTNPFTANPL